MNKRIQQLKNEEGFTLVELLIVIVILGILAGVVVFAVRGINERGQEQACKTDRQTLLVAQEARYAKTGNYGTETQLKDGGFIAEQSTLFDTEPSGSSYTITTEGVCAASLNKSA